MKKILMPIIGIFTFFILSLNVKAGNTYFDGSIPTSIYVGDSVKVTAILNNVEGQFSITSSNTGVLNGGILTDDFVSGSLTTYFTAQSAGTATLTLKPVNAADMDTSEDYYVSKYLTINVINRPQKPVVDVNKVYSSNNNLSGLSIDGVTITPEFNKDVLEYSVELDSSIEKINVIATKEDDKASITGAGELTVIEGKNTIKIDVTAQNGNVKTYVINALVKELNPTYVTINKKKYTIVKKKELLKVPNNYEETIVYLNDLEIPALKNDITKYILVGLKDEKGNIGLYIYDDKEESYTKYNEIKFNGINLFYMENNDNDYSKVTIKINKENVAAYKKKGYDYYLIYGMNLDTGDTNWYSYDDSELTLQRYIPNKEVNEKSNSYLFLIIILSSMIGLLITFILILLIKYNKNITKKID